MFIQSRSCRILLALAALPVIACQVDEERGSHESVHAPASRIPEVARTACASTQALAVDVTTATPSLQEGGGVARFTVTVKTLIDLSEAWIELRVPAGVVKPAGYPRNVGLVVGEPLEHSFELILPPGSKRHDIVAGMVGVHQGVDVAQFNNVWVRVGDAVEHKPVLTRSGSSLVREVRFGDPLRMDGR
jgi:hypothetical protein